MSLKDITSSIQKMPIEKLSELLKDLKKYQNMTKVSKKKAGYLFSRIALWEPEKKVFHFGKLDDATKKYILKTYHDTFWVKVSEKDITWEAQDSLDWGVRMFYGDDMVDVSLSQFKQQLIN